MIPRATDGSVRTSSLDRTSSVLLIVGAVNWGLVGLGEFPGADWNGVNLLLGSFPAVESSVYVVVGLAGRYELYFAYHLYAVRSGPALASANPHD